MSISNLTFAKYVGDGKRVSFPIATNGESMGYFRSLDINGYVDGEKVVTHIDYNSPHMLIFAVAPKDKSEVMVRREMPLRLPYANFERGNNFGHRQVNNTFLQQLYLTQELLDGFYPEGFYLKQDLNVGSNRVTNVADAKEDSDAINKGQVDAMDADMSKWQEEQDARILDLEQSLTAGDLVYRRVVFTATEGQTEFNPNATFGGILALYINGINQIAGEAYESVGGRIIRTVSLEEGDRVVAIIGQEPKFLEPEQTDFRYVRYPFFATGGETTYKLPADSKQVMSVYINGIHQTLGGAFEFDATTNLVTFAEALEGGDEAVVYAGSEPVVEGDASNLPVTSKDGSLTSTLRSWMQKIVNFGDNLVTSTGTYIARSLSDRFADEADVKDYGAVGDGITDDTVAILAALADHKTVNLRDGSYVFNPTTPMNLTSRKIIKGDAASLVGVDSTCFYLQSGSSLELYDVSVEGTTHAFTKMTGDVKKVIIERCDITGVSFVYGGVTSIKLLRVLDCSITGQTASFFRLRGDFDEVQIHRNNVTNVVSPTSGVVVFELGNTQLNDQPNTGNYFITNNTFDGITADGIGGGEVHALLLYGSFAHIHENAVKNVDRPNDPQSGGVEGIYTKISYGSISNNVMYLAGNAEGNKGAMINVKGFPKDDTSGKSKGYFITVTGNVCVGDVDKNRSGIRAEGDRMIISDNVIQRCVYAINYTPAGDTAREVMITDNVVSEHIGYSAIRVNTGGENITVQNNTVGEPHHNRLSDTEIAIQFLDTNRTGDISKLSIKGNTVRGAWNYGIYVLASTMTVNDLVIKDNIIQQSEEGTGGYGVRTAGAGTYVRGYVAGNLMSVAVPFRDPKNGAGELTYINNYNQGLISNP